jgi:hypothetical protein
MMSSKTLVIFAEFEIPKTAKITKVLLEIEDFRVFARIF